jgi:hypothetical protein
MPELTIHRTQEKSSLWLVRKLALQVGDDANASRLWIVEKSLRIGLAKIRFGGIAGVGTREEYRFKGYASRVMQVLSVQRLYNRLNAERNAGAGVCNLEGTGRTVFGIGDWREWE